jgi:hypothetical protein
MNIPDLRKNKQIYVPITIWVGNDLLLVNGKMEAALHPIEIER